MVERDLSAAWWSAAPTIEAEAPAPAASPIGALVERRAVYSRNSVAWVSARAWRKGAKVRT